MIASEPGGTFGLVLETYEASNGAVIVPGSIAMFGKKEVRIFLPSSRDSVYFFCLMLWFQLCGDEACKYAKDVRLPDFVRNTIATAKMGPQFVRDTMSLKEN